MAGKRTITAYERRIAKLLKRLSRNSDMVQGSLIEKYVQCGKPNCRCAKGEGHGPVYYLSFQEKGVTKLIYIPRGDVPKVRGQVAKFKQYKEIGTKIARMNREILRLKRKE
jgi:hypothetical protein